MTAPATTRTLDVPTPEAFGFLYDPPLGEVRYRVAYGGRGKGSSWQFSRALLIHGMTRKLRILCGREYQSSIKDSVHRILSDQITLLGLGAVYRVQEKSIVGRNGTEFLFKGLRQDIAQIKSTEGIDICWLEEAEAVSALSWRTLIPTIRKKGSEIWVSFNPALPTDATYVKFALNPPARSIVRRVSWRDNPYLPEVLLHEQEELLRSDPEAHAHVWGGEPWMRSDAQVLSGKWRVMDFTPKDDWQGPYYGADWGFASDPTVIVRVWIYDRRLYVEYDPGKPQLDNDQTAQLFRDVPGGESHVIRADNSRPETINEMKKRGLRVEGADKWPGSVADGIAHLRSYTEIVIHPRCRRATQEARLWRYKVDPRTQDVLPHLVDGSDHTWEAVRSALAPLIKTRPRVGLLFGNAPKTVAAQ